MRFLIFAVMVLPLPAFALSCMQHGVTDAFQQAAAAEEGYVPVIGTLDFDPEQVPRVDWSQQGEVPPVTLIPATFSGEAYGPRGVAQPFEADVVLEVRCSGPWCAQPKPGATLAFLRKTSHSYVLLDDACGAFLFGDPKPADKQQLRDCLAGRACEPLGRF
ncbi:MAG: hypothetical protein AAF727_06620 [Pseudomonadota bacterium]